MNIRDSIIGKNLKERAEIKAKKIASLDFSNKFSDKRISVLVHSIAKIEGGIELYAQAWKGGKQIGFGADGTVDTERFRIFNPPILVDDPNGDIVQTWIDPITQETKTRKLREDPMQAIQETLLHNVKVVGKDGSNIIAGKVGNTTDTFYSDTGGDGIVESSNGSYATAHDASSGTGVYSSGASLQFGQQYHTPTSIYYVWRSFFTFDTSSISSGDTVTSAIFSLYGTNKLGAGDSGFVANLVSNTQSSNTSLATGDFSRLGSTSLANTISYSSWNTAGYNDFTVTDLTTVTKAGWTKYALRTDRDISKTTPSNTSQLYGSSADETGTSQDPKLVIVHTGSSRISNMLLLDVH